MTYADSLQLREGTTLVIRSLEKRDAAAAIWIMRRTAEETRFLMREIDECGTTLSQEEEFVARMNDSPREALIGAFVEGELVGMANIAQVGARFRVRHRAAMGISLAKAYWGKRIGTAMMHALISLAKEAGYEQLELDVVESNERAAALYKKLGFETVGRIPHAMKYRDGSYADFLTMMMYL